MKDAWRIARAVALVAVSLAVLVSVWPVLVATAALCGLAWAWHRYA